MKTNKKALYIIGIAAALCIGFVAGLLVEYPAVNQDDLTGTVGKVNRYRKPGITENDIRLRSELLKDTAQLKKMIQGLVYFSVFTEEFSAQMDLAALSFQSKGLASVTPGSDKMQALRDYSEFIRNNNETLNATINLLSGFYQNGTQDASQDVEKNLRDFGNYVTQLNAREPAFTEALQAMDDYLLTDQKTKEFQEGWKNLKSVRDQLLLKGIQMGSLASNGDQVSRLLLHCIASQEKLGVLWGNEKLQRILSQDELRLLLFDKKLESVIFNQDLAASGLQIIYNQDNLSFLILDQSKLNQTVSESAKLQNASNYQLICLLGNDKLNVIMNNYQLQRLFMSPALSGILASNQLNLILSNGELSLHSWSTEGLNLLNLIILSSENLGLL